MTSRMGQVLLRVATSAVLLAAVTVGCSQIEDTPPQSEAQPDPPRPSPTTPEPATPEPEAPTEQHIDPRGEPTRVVIPAIDVDVDLVRLGLQADGAMQVPDFGLAGWYTEGPKPGRAGPAVIAAHVDSRAGPDVFYRLGDLTVGDEIHVIYDSGDDVTFLVDWSEKTPKDQLPVDTIWPTTNDRLLTLITCGGEFDRTERHYEDNLIVYTTLLSRPSGESSRAPLVVRGTTEPAPKP
jgi:sortase (surface protein transpeptidase)